MGHTATSINHKLRTAPIPARQPDQATVTVVIPCYNYSQYLKQAVESCLKQDAVAVDVIIVDDASTDDSLQVAQQLSRDHSNITVLSHSSNKGMVDTFNDGARTATGEFLVRLDADDLLTPGSLSRATDLARAYPSVGLIYGHPVHFSSNQPPKFRENASSWTIWPGLEWLTERCRFPHNVITSPEVLLRRSVVEQVGYQAPLRHTPDMEMWFRMSGFADVAYIHGADQAWHRDHPDSMSANEVDELVDMRERLEAFEVLFAGPVGAIPQAALLKETAAQSFLVEALDAAGHELDRGAGATELFNFCIGLVEELGPSTAQCETLRKLKARAQTDASLPWARPAALWRRALGRAKSEMRVAHWHRNGVY